MSTLPTEYDECVTFVKYLDLKKLLFSHIPNETYSPFMRTKMKNKRLGVRGGLPDYLICVDDNQSVTKSPIILFIEMKRVKGGVVSENQKKWLESLNKVGNVQAFVCKGFYEAKKVIDTYVL